MSAISYPYNLLQGLSDFWQKFFSDSDQLQSLYDGSTYLMGQAYLDLLNCVLSLSIVDCPLTAKEYWKLITIREDQISFIKGKTLSDDRYEFDLPSEVVSITTLNNKVIGVTNSLQVGVDFDLSGNRALFKIDPTNPISPGYAYRQLEVQVGGKFDSGSRKGGFNSWLNGTNVQKGDIIRLLTIGPAPDLKQVKVIDYRIVLVRDDSLYIDKALPPDKKNAASLPYTILRVPPDSIVTLEKLTFVNDVAQLAHTRIVQNTVKIYASVLATGLDVVEGVDFILDYESGMVRRITTWSPNQANINYQWLDTVFPNINGPPPYATDGVLDNTSSAVVTQLALWAPDVRVDRFYLSNNFGTLIGKESSSSEAYRTFLSGIFQLYILGPVLDRMESALNVVLGLPTIRTDDETLLDVVTSDPATNTVRTTRKDGTIYEYIYAKAIPLRTDVTNSVNFNRLTFKAFDLLTTAVLVTDYIKDSTWWHNIVIPRELYAAEGGSDVPDLLRRSISPLYVKNVINPIDGAVIGDPGVFIGADDEGNIPAAGNPIYRHRASFVLFDRFLKFHTFYVKFSDAVFVDTGVATSFARDPSELRKLVITSKPAHTYAYSQPTTSFIESIFMADSQWYQPQRFIGADPNAGELYDNEQDVPDLNQPRILLGLSIGPKPKFITDKFLFLDKEIVIGNNGQFTGQIWNIGDFFRYETYTDTVNFGGGSATLDHIPAGPKRRNVVRVYINAFVGGKKIVEGTDYTVDYATGDITRLTAWDNSNVSVTFIQLNIDNVANSAPDPSLGDTLISINALDSALIRGSYAPDTDDPMSFVERTLQITIS